MEEAGEKLKFVQRGNANVLIKDTDESEKVPKANIGNRSRKESSFFIRNPRLLAIMSVLGVGVGTYLIPNNPSSFGHEFSVLDKGNKVLNAGDLRAEGANVFSFPKPFEEAYSGFLPGEGEEALSYVMEQGAAMEKNLGTEEQEQVLEYKNLVDESVKGTHVPADLLLGLIATESLGDRFARSDAGDYLGLTQMSAEIAAEQGLENLNSDENDDRFIPEKIIPATARELEKYWERYQDTGLMLGAWHMGTKNMYEVVQEYVADVYSRRLPDIETDDEAEAERRINLYRKEIAGVNLVEDPDGGLPKEVKIHPKINMWRLFNNENVAAITGGPGWDKTIHYVPRIVTAAQILRNSVAFAGEISEQ